MEENNKEVVQETNNVVQGEASGWWGFLGFMVPLAGLIIFCATKSNHPSMAKKAGIGALVSVCITVAFYILIFVLLAAAGSM